MKDSDLKKQVEKAASIHLAAPFLKVPQAMRAAGFLGEDTQDAAKQMHIRRAILRAQQLQKEALPVRNTVSVPSGLPTTNSTISSLTSTTLVSVSRVIELLLKDEINRAPPKLEEVQLTVGAATKLAGNKKKIDKWMSTALKAATKMYHAEQKKGEDSLSANQDEGTIERDSRERVLLPEQLHAMSMNTS